MFDRDQEGINRYNKLPAYFRETAALEAKLSQNKRAAAFLLPVSPGREGYFNLAIEFLFSDEALSLQTAGGFGLVFRQPDIEKRARCPGNPLIGLEQSDLPETRQIVGGKTVFAEQIVPTLDRREFEHFVLVFDKIHAILEHLLVKDSQPEADTDPKGKKPTDFVLSGKRYEVSSWVQLLLKICSILAEQHGSDFAEKATAIRGAKRPYVTDNPEELRQPGSIPETELYVEKNLNSQLIVSVVERILEALGYSEEDLEVHWQ
jgi:hypothetical protein